MDEESPDSIVSLEARVRMLARRLEQIPSYENRRKIQADLRRFELVIAKWTGVPPSEAQRDAMLDSLRELEGSLEAFAPARAKPSLPPPAPESDEAGETGAPEDKHSARSIRIAAPEITDETHVMGDILGQSHVAPAASHAEETDRLVNAPRSKTPAHPFMLRRMWRLHRFLSIVIILAILGGIGAAIYLIFGL